jgi:hypothetical protein
MQYCAKENNFTQQSYFIEEIPKACSISLLYKGMALVIDPSQKLGFRHFVITDCSTLNISTFGCPQKAESLRSFMKTS